MNVVRMAVAAACAAGLCLAVWAQAPSLEGLDIVLDVVPAGPVALVNNRPIPSEDFIDLYTSELNRYQQLSAGETITDAFRIGLALRCMRMLIEKELLLQEAEKRNITVSDAAVQEQWALEAEQLGHFLSPDPENPLSEAEILEQAGTTREEALGELRQALIVEKMREIIAEESGVTVTEEEVREQFEELRSQGGSPSDRAHLRQVFVRAPQDTSSESAAARQEARKKAEDALGRIRAGMSFQAVARDVSDEPFSSQGGDMGPARIDTMPDFMADAARTLSPGQVSGVIESSYGYHIIELVELLPGEELTYERAAPYIRSRLLLHKTNLAVDEFCRKATEGEGAIQTALDLDRKLLTHPELLDMLAPQDMPEGLEVRP